MKQIKITVVFFKTIALTFSTSLIHGQDIHMPALQELNILYNPALKTDKTTKTYVGFRTVNYPGIISYSSKLIAIELPLVPRNEDFTDVTRYFDIAAAINTTGATDRSLAASGATLALTYALPLDGYGTYISAGFNANYNFNNIGTSIYGGYYPEGFDKQDALGAAIVADPFLSGYNFGYFSSGAGISVFHTDENTQWYAGVSTRNFNHPYTEWNRTSRLGSNNGVQAGYTTTFNEIATIGGYANFSWHNGVYEHFLGATYTRNLDDSSRYKVTGGIGFRLGDALVPSVALKLKNTLVSFFYDLNLPNTIYKLNRRKAYSFSLRIFL
ncbi:MAG: hypothetical protein IPP48_06360 [Chitinophagaceae bacterium]|nr:hypothetical protein [Chitinophagaceae bacterium]